jgi:hypothetical protein
MAVEPLTGDFFEGTGGWTRSAGSYWRKAAVEGAGYKVSEDDLDPQRVQALQKFADATGGYLLFITSPGFVQGDFNNGCQRLDPNIAAEVIKEFIDQNNIEVMMTALPQEDGEAESDEAYIRRVKEILGADYDDWVSWNNPNIVPAEMAPFAKYSTQVISMSNGVAALAVAAGADNIQIIGDADIMGLEALAEARGLEGLVVHGNDGEISQVGASDIISHLPIIKKSEEEMEV